MEACHKYLCGRVFVGNGENGVEDVTMKKTSKGIAGRDKNGLFGQFIQRAIKMMPKKEDSKTVNVIEVNEKKEMFEREADAKHFWVRMLKEMLWVFAIEMGREGCPICTCFSPMF